MTASDAYAGLQAGTFNIPAQERIVHGQPAGAAVRAEAERLGARRVFLVSGRSLGALADGPLQRVAAALGPFTPAPLRPCARTAPVKT